MNLSETSIEQTLPSDLVASEDGSKGGGRAYEAPRLQRHADLPVITAVQSCDFFSADGCS